MQTTIQYMIIGTMAIAMLVILTVAWISVLRAQSNGYDLGYGDAQRGYRTHIDALHEDITAKAAKIKAMETQHQADREALLLDCDNRIAHYSRRSNPLTLEHAGELMKISGQLQYAANLFRQFNAIDKAAWANDAAAMAMRLSLRVHDAIAASEAQENAA
jgi:hypothetical protein